MRGLAFDELVSLRLNCVSQLAQFSLVFRNRLFNCFTLLEPLRSQLLAWVKKGAAWIVLALLESAATGAAVRKELKPAAAQVAKCDAPGCKNLLASLKAAA